ncbi:hypothetical protein OG909_05175 [Streptomyces sp. NBC_01754]|uniref:hypothetical protein n=1 Tax=Streptomyces sp. NBC_01754 TaxID=2975930 RepID=UPI002DD996C2|nr:hypothetical protein [Streptomyces sp. NBC_01754]WSC96741.1 hypothetical protein OG909_05175 [Streptomyces sp. NBC_01754]
MPRMLDVSEDVRAEIGDAEADRLLVGDSAPGSYDCTSCRTPGDSDQERTSTVLFVGDETAVLAFAHATCIPSQVVKVAEDQLKGAMRSITGDETPTPEGLMPEQAVLGITSGLVLIEDDLRPALVVEPTGPIARPGTDGRDGDQFLQLLLEQGFQSTQDLNRLPGALPGWSVLLAVGRLHAVLQPGPGGGQVAWWQAHQPLQVTEGWRTAANKSQTVLVFAAPAGAIGQQPREDLLRDALDKAAANGQLVAAALPLAGT